MRFRIFRTVKYCWYRAIFFSPASKMMYSWLSSSSRSGRQRDHRSRSCSVISRPPSASIASKNRRTYANRSLNRRSFPYHNYLTLVAEEVAGIVSSHYAIPFERQHWAIGGFSFGGYLSMDVGRRYAGRFASVSVISGLVDKEWSFWPAQPPPPGPLDSQGRGKHTIVAPGPVPRLFLACGSDDRLFSMMLGLHQKLTELGIPHEWSTGPGGHTWKYWSSVLPQMFRFHLASQ